MSRQTVRALARSKEVFYASVAGELFSGLFMGPIRGQMTRCILPTEIGKVAPAPCPRVPAQCAGVRDAGQPRVRRPHPRQHDLHLHLQRHLGPRLPLAGHILLRWLGLPSPG